VAGELGLFGLPDKRTRRLSRAVKSNSFRKSNPTVAGSFPVIPPSSSTIIPRHWRQVDKSVNFHSFHHGIADAFRNAGYLDEQFNMLLGHAKATTTGIYGNVPQGILSQPVEMIEAVSFSGVNNAGSMDRHIRLEQ
jgi:hypothetical protein